MMDLRYHIVSLVAVFLALSAGIVMGTAITGVDRQDRVVRSLKDQFEALARKDSELKAENAQLGQRLATWRQVGAELRAPALRGQLAGQRVAVVVCGATALPDYWPPLRATLDLAGAAVGPTAFLPDEPERLTPMLRQRFTTLWDPGVTSPGPIKKYEALGWFVRAIHLGGYGQRVEQLARGAGIRIDGPFSDPVTRLLVLLAPPDPDRARRAAGGDVPEVALAEAAAANGLRLVAGEEGEAANSLVEYLARRGAATVDNIDTDIGQLAAVLALAGADGAFGVKPGATAPIPALSR
jgi:hypothetical protein